MKHIVNDPASVTLMYNHHQQRAVPIEIIWKDKHYPVTRHTFHDHFKNGNAMRHTFSVESLNRSFKISFDTEDLSWVVEEVGDIKT